MSTDKTSLGDRMKGYEDDSRFMPLLPIVARLDGRSFHTFCRGLAKPYDERLNRLMVETTKSLVEETQALLGYTQSDEITLVWYSANLESKVFFDGRVAKMVSILAAMATLEFNRLLPTAIPEKAVQRPLFDCRAFQVPTLEEAANCFLWRERDATKNSVSAAGQANFSHKQLQGLNGSQIQERLFQEKGINWNDYPAFFKRGTFVQKRRVARPFSTEEFERLPAKHAARTDPGLVVERWETRVLDLPPFGTVTNRTEVVFEGADPKTAKATGVANDCPDCGTPYGEPHRDGCDVEVCPECGGQALGCGCDADHAVWTGEWPGRAECRARGWFCQGGFGPHFPWRPCPPDALGAVEDLNRLAHWKATGKDDLYEDSPAPIADREEYKKLATYRW